MNVISFFCLILIAFSFAYIVEMATRLAFHVPKRQVFIRVVAITILSSFALYIFLTWRYPRDPYELVAKRLGEVYIMNSTFDKPGVESYQRNRTRPHFNLVQKEHVRNACDLEGSILFRCVWSSQNVDRSTLQVDYIITPSNTIFKVNNFQ